MFPSKQKPYSGIFVKNQYEALLKSVEKDDSAEIFAMKRSFTSKPISIIKYIVAFIKFLPRFFKKYDVVHLHYFYPLIIPVYLYKKLHPKTKVVATFHGTDISLHIGGGIHQKLFRFLAKVIDIPISVGADLAIEIKNKLGLEVEEILSAGVDQNIFKPVLATKQYDFIFVGSFIKRKGLDLLLSAIQEMGDEAIRYCIVGSGELEQDVISVQKRNTITLLKNQTHQQLCDLYNQSRFFILPSRKEPFGLVATEAMFCSTPAIVSNVGGLKDQVKEGVNGLILKDHSVDIVVQAIEKAHKMPKDEYRQMAISASTSNKEHSMKCIISQLISIYKNG